MTNNIASICEQNNITYINSHVVSGGDISSSFAVDTTDGRMFLKLNSADRYPLMFTREAEALNCLAQASLLKVPRVITHGVFDEQQYLLLEWLEKTAPPKNFWRGFAEALCHLHSITQQHFGWSTPNYIGSLIQQNEPKLTWAEFYTTQRIMPLVQRLFNMKCLSVSNTRAAETVCVKFPKIFPDEPPALVHGDLWAGNFMAVASDKGSEIVPAVFDPAVYFGHREMDLGMTLLFGGFDSTFYSAYNEVMPLEKNWRKRETLTQLYPLLVHAVLFGGSYVSRCKSIINEWT